MLHEIFRSSNKFWHAMYYDQLVETDHYQISYLEDADRSYFNAAHAIKSAEPNTLDQIESYFKKHSIPVGIYIDPETPISLEKLLIKRGYLLIPEEQENWHIFNCSKTQLQELELKINEFQLQNPCFECILFSPITRSSLLNQFIEINGYVNEISANILSKLKENLINPKEKEVRFICTIVLNDGQPTSTGLIGFYNNMAFFAEGATHPKFRQHGIFSWLRRINMLYIIKQNCDQIIVNCDKEAFSNNTYRRLGFSQICQRNFYIKPN